MSLVERFTLPLSAHFCQLGSIILSLEPEEAAATRAALEDRSFSNTYIAISLKAEGYKVGKTTVGDHRNKVCRCHTTRELNVSD